jgi:hypothetical protein
MTKGRLEIPGKTLVVDVPNVAHDSHRGVRHFQVPPTPGSSVHSPSYGTSRRVRETLLMRRSPEACIQAERRTRTLLCANVRARVAEAEAEAQAQAEAETITGLTC